MVEFLIASYPYSSQKIRSLNGTIEHYNKSWKKRIQITLVFEVTLFVMRLHSVP